MDWDAFLEEDVFDAFFEWIVPLVSLLLLGLLTILLRWQVEDPLLSVLNLLLPALFVTLIVYQGLVLHDSALPSGERRTVATWYAVGIYTMVGLGAWTFLLSMLGGEPVPRSVEAVTEIVAGGMFGFLVGIAQLRAEQNAEAATQAELEQEFLERQQDTNEVLNRFLIVFIPSMSVYRLAHQPTAFLPTDRNDGRHRVADGLNPAVLSLATARRRRCCGLTPESRGIRSARGRGRVARSPRSASRRPRAGQSRGRPPRRRRRAVPCPRFPR
jgi:hypothetical protein